MKITAMFKIKYLVIEKGNNAAQGGKNKTWLLNIHGNKIFAYNC